MKSLRVKSRTGAAVAGTVLLFGGLAAAPALGYPVGVQPTLSCPATVAAGSTVTCTAENAEEGATLTLSFQLVAAGANDATTISRAAFILPAASVSASATAPTTPGNYSVVGNLDGTVLETTTETTITVTAATTGGGGGGTGTDGGTSAGGDEDELTKTGASNTALGFAAAIGAIGLGGGLYAASRRKRV